MIRRLPPILLVFLTLGLVGLPAVAQTASSEVEIEEIEVSNYPEVLILVTAPSRFQATDLASNDWVVTEDGERQTVSEAIRVGGEDIEAVLVIDTSGSMQGEPLLVAMAAAEDFLDRLPVGTRVALVTFGAESRVSAGFTEDLTVIRDALRGLVASGETALYDAVVEAAGLFSSDEGIQRSMIVLTDGADTASTASESQASRAVGGADTAFYAIELQTPETQAEPLASLAAATGGVKVGATQEDLGTIYDEIAARITSQYLLHYSSSAQGRTTLGVSLAQEGDVEPALLPVRFPVTGSVSSGPSTTPTTEPAPATPPPTLAGSQPTIPFLASRGAIWIGLAGVFVGIAVLLLYLIRPGDGSSRSSVRPSFRTNRQQAVSSVARGLVGVADRAIARRGKTGGLDGSLERAGINLRAGEYLVIAGLAIVVVFAGGLALLSSPILAVLVAAFVAAGALYFVTFMGNRRQRAFENQLPDVLSMLASTIRTGYAPLQATELVARETGRPAHEELNRVVAEARLGRDYIDAMAAAAIRTRSNDLQWVVEAMGINRDVGGDISELLDNVAETIRSRVSLRRMISALSAEGRLSAWVLILLPFGLAAFINISNPGYLRPLVEHPFGIVMIVAAVISMGLGIFFISKILDLEA